MRHIGSIPDESRANRFGAHLLTLGIRNSVEAGGNGAWAVWVEDDDHLDRSRGELEAFLRNPDDSKYDGAEKRAAAVRAAEKKKHERLRKRFVDVRTSWASGGRSKAPAIVVLIVLSFLVTFLTRFGRQMDPVGNAVMFSQTDEQDWRDWLARQKLTTLATTPDHVLADRFYRETAFNRIRQGQVWRLVTSIFLHLNPFHLLFNMLMLANMGALLETKKRTVFFVTFVLATAVFSNVVQAVWDNPYGGGMSGVLYAVFGYVWMKDRFEPELGLHVGQSTVVTMMVWLVLCMTGMLGPIANAAHVGGLLIGALWGYSPTGWRKMKREFRR